MEGTKKNRVLQGHSVCHQGIWFNQGDEFESPAGAEFKTTRPKYDEAGKYLGDEEISQVETIQPAREAQKEEG